MPAWTEAEKQKAITIAQAAGAAEASRATAIPSGTIRSWVHRLQHEPKSQKHDPSVATQQRITPQLQKLQDQVFERAVEEASEYITERLKGLADKLYSLAEKSVLKVDVAISDPEDKLPPGVKRRRLPHDRDGAAWLRSLVGVLAQSIDKAQLLSGKPTARPEVVNRREYEITQRIITERPDLLDAIFEEDQQPGLANRCRSSAHPGLGELR